MNKIHIILNNKLLTAIASAFLFLFPLHVVFIFFKNLFYDLGLIKATKINSRVVSIGNVLLGGTGKTPTTIAIANFLQKNGFTVGIVTRGHGRKNETNSFLLKDHHWSECGDEVIILKNNLQPNIPIYVSRNKVFAAQQLSNLGCNVILLDDGFQHRKIYRDIDIVLIGPENYVKKNQLIYPYGLLREPFSSLKRADITISTKRNLIPYENSIQTDHRLDLEVKKEVLSSGQARSIHDFSNKSGILALCSIGDPKSFEKTLKNIKILTDRSMFFPDHWPFSKKDIDKINQTLTRDNLNTIVCTEKDYVKLYEFRNLLKADINAIVLKHDLNQDIKADILGRLV